MSKKSESKKNNQKKVNKESVDAELDSLDNEDKPSTKEEVEFSPDKKGDTETIKEGLVIPDGNNHVGRDLESVFSFKDRDKHIDLLNKKLKKDKITHGADPRLEFKVIPTCSISLNHFMGGGYRRRKIHLIYGEKSVGKSFFDYKNIATLQRLCRNCLGVLPVFTDRLSWFLLNFFGYKTCNCESPQAHICGRLDLESDYSSVSSPEDTDKFKKKLSHMEALGVIPEMLTVGFAASVEDAIDITKEWVPSLYFDYISIDSIQGTQSDYVYGKDGDEDTMGIDPRKINILLRNMIHSFHEVGIDSYSKLPAINLVSQVRIKIGPTVSYADHSGGEGLKHQSSSTLKFNRLAYLGSGLEEYKSHKDHDIAGIRMGYINDKSKIDSPYYQGEVDFFFKDTKDPFYKKGDMDYFSEYMKVSIITGKIKQRGAYFYVGDESIQGIKNLREYLINNPKVLMDL